MLGLLGGVGTGGESGEGVKGPTDDIGHEWRDATREERSEDCGEDENEEVATGEEGEEQRNRWLGRRTLLRD